MSSNVCNMGSRFLEMSSNVRNMGSRFLPRGRRSDCLGVIDRGMILARGKRKVIRGFRLHKTAGQSQVSRVRCGGHVSQSGIFFA